MNVNDPWKKLSEALRERRPLAGDQGDTVPHGLYSRVLANVRPPREMTLEAWFRLSLRALPLALAVLFLCWVSLPTPNLSPPVTPENDLAEMVFEEALP